MYIRDMVGSVARPVKELKGFERIHLKKGESRTVSFDITAEQLKFYNSALNWVCEPGARYIHQIWSNDRKRMKSQFIV